MAVNITFLGGGDTATGSKYLVTHGQRLRNWTPLPVAPGQINAVVLTHTHLDHSGYLPLLAREGFSGPVYGTPGTRDLCRILCRTAATCGKSTRGSRTGTASRNMHPPSRFARATTRSIASS